MPAPRNWKKWKGKNLAKAVVLNEALRRKARKGWNSVEVIRYWRQKRCGRSGR